MDHLGADRDVERRHRLVADEALRLEHERRGDHDALALTARELVRVAVPEALRRAQAGPLEGRQSSLDAVVPALSDLVDLERLLHQRADAHPRVERLVGILEHHLDPAPEPPHL